MEKNQTNNEYCELVDFLSQKFDGLDRQFDEIKTVLKTKADKRDLEMKADKSDIDIILTRLNHISNVIGDNRTEQLATRRQVENHEKWISKASQKIGIELP
jgi:chromosome segregation ATPase